MKVTLDTTCFIDAFSDDSCANEAMRKIRKAHEDRLVSLTVSRHTISEVQRPKEAVYFVKFCEVLPHFPIGSWGEQVAAWNEVSGTWNDAKKNQDLQKELEELSKSGNDIRDRGAYIDAIRAGMDAFVTSDKQFVGSGPAKRIEKRFGLRVITPQHLVEELKL